MPSLWFVTPAFRRYELSAVCFDQRRHVIETLGRVGIEAHCVVVADDGNLDLARERGFAAVERDNEWLGRRFNDGIEYAARHGAHYIVPIGSDSWIDPAYFVPLPRPHITRSSHLYSVVTADRIAELRLETTYRAAGPFVLQRDTLRAAHYRPAVDEIKAGVDRSTINGIAKTPWEHRDIYPFQYVGFRGEPSLNTYDALFEAFGTAEYVDPWTILARHYPDELVDRARQVMVAQAIAA